jgi:DNA polymerase-3 subunit epsilon
VAVRGRSVRGYLADLRATAETPAGPDDELAASVDETELVLRWMEKPGTRLVDLTGTLASRTPGTGSYSDFLARVEAGRSERDPFADNRALGTRAQPDRVRAGQATPGAGQPTTGRGAARATGPRTTARRRRLSTGLASPA